MAGQSFLLAADWPSFVETVRQIYENAELANLFNACTRSEEVRFKFYLMSGFRDAEGRFATWHDVDFKHMAVRVKAKLHWGFHPENWQEREVPVPQKLIEMLADFRPANAAPDEPLFPSKALPTQRDRDRTRSDLHPLSQVWYQNDGT
jgi:integrase